MSKIMSVGGYNPSKIAVGVSLDAEGKVQVNNPKVDKIIGTIVEPHDDSYRGLVAVLGANCIANVALLSSAYCRPFKDGNTYVIGTADYLYILDQNLNIIKSSLNTAGGAISGCYADSNYVYTIKTSTGFKIEKYKKSDLSFVKEVVSPVSNYRSASQSGVVTLVGDDNHLYSILRGKILKYDKDLNLVASKDLSEPPVSALANNSFHILGVHNNKLIFGMFISLALSRIFSVNMATLDVAEIGSGVISVASFIDGENVVSVGETGMQITNISTGVTTTHTIVGNFRYIPSGVTGISNGKYAVISGDTYQANNILEVREFSSQDGYESRVYRIKLDFIVTSTYIDDIGRVWVMGNNSIMLLNDELTLKGYRIV